MRKLDETITVSFSIALLQLISVVEKEQVLKTNVWLQVVRKKKLNWDKEDFCFFIGIEMAWLSNEMESREIWRNSINSSATKSCLDSGC